MTQDSPRSDSLAFLCVGDSPAGRGGRPCAAQRSAAATARFLGRGPAVGAAWPRAVLLVLLEPRKIHPERMCLGAILVSTEEPLWPVTGRSHRHVTKAAGGSQKADVMFYKKKAPEPGLNAQFGGFSTPLALLSLLPSPLLPRPLLERRETLGEE